MDVVWHRLMRTSIEHMQNCKKKIYQYIGDNFLHSLEIVEPILLEQEFPHKESVVCSIP